MLWTDGRTQRGVGRENSLDVKVSGCVDQLALLYVDQQSKVSQEIGTENISDDEDRRRPRLRVSDRWLYVVMGVLFTAISASLSVERR